ncbi:hypothetical protein A2U01_0085031, partial [Trifolium medium]|nr:hypothetical protein [Trifolium medium]
IDCCSTTVLSPAEHDDVQIPETDPKDELEGSPFTEDEEDVSVLTERRSGKQPQFRQETPVDKAQPIAQLSKSDTAEVLAAFRHTN